MLEGSWIPAPNQEGDCGYGTTTLSRRVLKKNTPLFNAATARTTPKTDKKTDPSKPLLKNFTDKNKIVAPPVVKNDKPAVTVPPVVKPIAPLKAEPDTDKPAIVKNDMDIKKKAEINFGKRNNTVLKTIEIENETFKVDLYDNGDIDGDSISLFFNGKLLLAHKRLSDKSISLSLNVEDNRNVNELVMYAENLGTIPPNTALMVVTDGPNRYEVRISSDLEKSGVIRFVHKPKAAQ